MRILTIGFTKKNAERFFGVLHKAGANTQGKTLGETKENVVQAIRLVIQANRHAGLDPASSEIMCRPCSTSYWGRLRRLLVLLD